MLISCRVFIHTCEGHFPETPMKSSIHPTLPFLISCTACFTAHGATVTDDFSANHDYSGRNVAGTIWDGVMFNSGFSGPQNATMLAANANTSNAGRLTLQTSSGDWDGAGDDGVFLYRNVSGDFTMAVDVISATVVNYHDLGLMARVANEADAGPGQDLVAGRYFAAGTANNLRSVDNSVETNSDAAGLLPFLMLSRTGNVFTYTRANDSAFTSGVITHSVTRNDLDGLSLQVGIWQATFTGSPAIAVFDNFSLTTVPEPAVAALAGMGMLAFLKRRR